MYKYLKVFLVITILSIVAATTTTVSANSGPPISGITIEPDICEILYEEDYSNETIVFPNNFDILVRTTDFDVDDFSLMTDKYKEVYPFYETIDYLNEMESGWTSFSAYYVKDYNWGYGPYCGIYFGGYREVELMESIILVYFDDNGDTLFKSEEIDVPDVLFYQDREPMIYFNTTTLSIDSSQLRPTIDVSFLIGVFFLILYSVIIELVIAIIFKFRTKKMLLNILLINVITQIAMYIYFYFIYNPHGHSYSEHLFFYEILVLIVEFFFLHWRFKKVIPWRILMFYVLVSNVISYFLGVFRYM